MPIIKETIIDKRLTIKRDELSQALRDTISDLGGLLEAVWPKSDSRLSSAELHIRSAVWDAWADFPTEEVSFEVTHGDVLVVTNKMHGKVLTVLEALFPERVQREALKSLAKGIVWRFYNRITESI